MRILTGTVPSGDFTEYTAETLSGIPNAVFTQIWLRHDGTANLQMVDLFRPTVSSTPPPAEGAVLTGNSPPFNLFNGDTLILDVNGAGDDTATFNATAAVFQPSANEPYNMAGGKVWYVICNGGSETTVTFVDGDFFVPGAATAAEIATVLAAQLPSSVVADTNLTKFRVTSQQYGTGSEVVLNGGTVPWAFDASVFGTGDAVDLSAATIAEVKTVVETDIAGVIVGTAESGAITITTVATGEAVTLEMDAGSTAPLGFSTLTQNGQDEGEADSEPYTLTLNAQETPLIDLSVKDRISLIRIRSTGDDASFTLGYMVAPFK